ncbi:MAG: hypothetical protein ACRDIV_19370 [Ktedonobacteraceae bacterium]
MSENTDFLTSREIRETYNIPKSTLHSKIIALGIKGELPLGKQRGASFAPEDVERILESLGINKSRKGTRLSKNQIIFRRAYPEDAQEMHELGERVMRTSGEHSVPTKILLQFLSLPGSEIGHALVKNGHIVGYFTFVPLKHDKVMQIMQKEASNLFNQLRTRELLPEDLAQFEPDEPIDIFVWEVVSDQKITGRYLIGYMGNFLHLLGKRGVNIEGVYAVATTPQGRDLCQRIGMKRMNLPEVTRPDWTPFEWKIQENKNWLTKNYIQAIKSYKKRQKRMQMGADSPASASDDI